MDENVYAWSGRSRRVYYIPPALQEDQLMMLADLSVRFSIPMIFFTADAADVGLVLAEFPTGHQE